MFLVISNSGRMQNLSRNRLTHSCFAFSFSCSGVKTCCSTFSFSSVLPTLRSLVSSISTFISLPLGESSAVAIAFKGKRELRSGRVLETQCASKSRKTRRIFAQRPNQKCLFKISTILYIEWVQL